MIRPIPGLSGELDGYIAQDPRIVHTADGQDIINFSIALNPYPVVEGLNEPIWFQCVGFGDTCQKLAPILNKGDFVSVSGYLKYRAYVSEGVGATSKDWVIDRCERYEHGKMVDLLADGSFKS